MYEGQGLLGGADNTDIAVEGEASKYLFSSTNATDKKICSQS